MESYNPENLKHVPGQEGRVDDMEKAYTMADDENKTRDILLDFYNDVVNSKPGHFDEGYQGLLGELEVWRENGVTPEYLKKVAEIEAEREGALFDYESSLIGKSVTELRAEMVKNYVRRIATNISVSRKGGEAGIGTLAGTAERENNATESVIANRRFIAVSREIQNRKEKK